MMAGMKRIAMTALMATASFGGLRAQSHALDSRTYFDYGDPLMTSVIQSPDGRTAEVRVSTASAMFSFQRPRETSHGAYYAIRDVTIEVTEKGDEQPVLTRNIVDTIYVRTFEQSTAKDDWHAMSARIDLPKLDPAKQYSTRIEIRDGIDRLVMRPVISALRTPSFANTADSNGVAIGDIMLADSVRGLTAYTAARDHSYMFSHDVIGTVTFKLADTLPGDPLVDIHVRQVTNLIDLADTGERGRFVVSNSDLHKDTTLELQDAEQSLRYALVPSKDGKTWTAIFTVPGKQFQQGKYAISVRVKSGAAERTQTNEFYIEWQDMPISLADPVAAIEPLQYILTQGEFKDMQSGSKQEMIQKLYAYWHKQDPTPGTAFNERMAAFYSRVDYADFNYANTRLLDGVMTDRGKIYLLYGAPTHVERSFLPGESPVETWTYSNNVRRIFRFEERTHGEYKLTDVTNLAATN
jgi:GWxTD domain-containing protein